MLRPTIYLPSRRHRLLDQRLMARPAPPDRPTEPPPAPPQPPPELEPEMAEVAP